MTLIIELPPEVEARLRAEADSQGRPAESLAADAVAAFYEDDLAEPEPEAVEGVRRGLAALDAGDVMPFEDYVADVMEKRRQRDAARQAPVA